MLRRNSLLHSPYTRIGAVCLLASFFVLLVFSSLQLRAAERDVQPDAPGSISGHVTDRQGHPLAEIYVDLYSANYPYGQRQVRTDRNGYYKFPILTPNEYQVGFRDFSIDGYLPQFYKNSPSLEAATKVVVIGEQVENIDVALQRSSQITGTISIAGSSITESQEASVIAYKWIDAPSPHWGSFENRLWIDSTGIYTVSSLSSGVYRICAIKYPYYTSDYLIDCYGNVSYVEAAQDVLVGEESTTGGIDIVFNDGSNYATIAGKVTDPAGKPISNTQVSIARVDGQGGGIGYEYYATTNEQGQYEVNTLVPDIVTYTVAFRNYPRIYVNEYYQDVYTLEEAQRLTPKAHQIISNINAVLEPASQITGMITLQSELPGLPGYVYAIRKVGDNWQPSESGSINPGTGQYQITGLPAGTYRVCSSFSLGDQYIGGCLGAKELISATDVVVGVGEVRGSVNFDISTDRYEGLIAGRVEGDGAPLKGIRVDLNINPWSNSCPDSNQTEHTNRLQPSSSDSPNINVIHTYTDKQGRYAFQGLEDGSYKLLFSDPQATYATLYYSNTLNINDSQGLEIKCGTHHEDVNISLPKAGAISGKVRLVTSQPVSDATIAIFWNNGTYWQSLYTTYHTDQNGNYLANGLPPATYLVYVTYYQPLYNFPYIYEDYYGTATSRIENAAPVVVNSGETTANIDVIFGPDGLLWLPVVRKEN